MFDLKAFDPVGLSIESNGMMTQGDSSLTIPGVSAELVAMYEGNQMPYVQMYLQRLFKNAKVRARYQELAVIYNIVRLLVDRVSTLGQQPIRVVWRENDTFSEAAQEKWDQISADILWDAFVSALDKRTNLCKTVVAHAGWSKERGEITASYYTPNQIRVGYSDEASDEPLFPDIFSILRDEQEQEWQRWDFSSRELGASGVVYDADDTGMMLADSDLPQPYPIIDPRTGRSLIPFIPFRTERAQNAYFIWDGQQELINAQYFVNRCYTQLSHQLHYGAFKIPVLKGGGWVGRDGKSPELLFDPSEAIVCPTNLLDTAKADPSIEFLGPGSEAVISSLIEVVGHWIENLAVSFHLNPSSIRVKNEATSGYALQIESAALKSKLERTRTHSQKPLRRFVEMVRLIWDYNNPANAFPAGATFQILIPDYNSGVTTREEVEMDVMKLENGLVSFRSLVYKYNPSISSETVEEMIAAKEAKPEPPAPIQPPPQTPMMSPQTNPFDALSNAPQDDAPIAPSAVPGEGD